MFIENLSLNFLHQCLLQSDQFDQVIPMFCIASCLHNVNGNDVICNNVKSSNVRTIFTKLYNWSFITVLNFTKWPSNVKIIRSTLASMKVIYSDPETVCSMILGFLREKWLIYTTVWQYFSFLCVMKKKFGMEIEKKIRGNFRGLLKEYDLTFQIILTLNKSVSGF